MPFEKYIRPKGNQVKLRKDFGLLLALLLLTLSGMGRSYAQDDATPISTPSPAIPQTPADQATPGVSEKLSVDEKLNALETENQGLEERLKALEEKVQATPATETPAFGPGEGAEGNGGGNSTRGVHDLPVPLTGGDEYMYSEGRYLSFSNPEGDTEFRIGGYQWTDLDMNLQTKESNGQYQFLNGGTANGFDMRKAHLDFRGSFDKFVGAAIGIESDKSTGVSLGLFHAYAFVKFDKAFVFQAGKLTNDLSLEGLQPSADLPFVEASMIANLTVNKVFGAEIHGDVNHFMDYVVEIDNGQQDNESSATGPVKPTGDMKDLTGRVFFTPWEKSGDEWLEGLGFGGGGSWDNETNEDTAVWSKLETSFGGNAFATYNGIIPRSDYYHLDGQGYYYHGPFGLMAEWVQSSQWVGKGTTTPMVLLSNIAWLTEIQWVFGGKAGFEGAEVDHPFNPSKGYWGALELVARTDANLIDPQSFATGFPYSGSTPMATGAEVAEAYGFGFNWWLNENFKWMCDFETTNFAGGNEKVLPEDELIARAALTL